MTEESKVIKNKKYYTKNAKQIIRNVTANHRKKMEDVNYAERIRQYHSNYNDVHRIEKMEKMRNLRQTNKGKRSMEDRILHFKRQIASGNYGMILIIEIVVCQQSIFLNLLNTFPHILGPNYVCQSCDRRLFRTGVNILGHEGRFTIEKLIKQCTLTFLKTVIRNDSNWKKVDAKIVLCHNCLRKIQKKSVPLINHSNGLELEEVPEELRVTDLEQQMFAKDLIFMKIRQMPRSGMKLIEAKVVNVPLHDKDVEDTLNILPRPLNEAEIVEIQLKKKLEMKAIYSNKYIRADVPRKAVKKLKELGNPHYMNVRLREESEMNAETLAEEPMEINDEDEKNNEEPMEIDDENKTNDETEPDDEKVGFGTNAEPLRNADTCLLPENQESKVVVNETGASLKNVIEIAPGEGKQATMYLRAQDFDVKAFPRHHPSGKYGIHMERDQKISAQKFFSQRLLNKDPRFSNDMSYLFMAQQYIERQNLERQISIAGRKGTVQSRNGPNKTVHLNDIYNVFKQIRGSPKYWQTARNELIAKVKYLGPFHGFFTLSCGEMRWFEVFATILGEKGITVEFGEDWNGNDEKIMVDGKALWDYINDLDQSKHELLKDSLITVTRHFENRVREFIKNILLGEGLDKDGSKRVKIKHYCYRVEFQARGMPHIHGVFWIDKTWLEEFGIKGDLLDQDNIQKTQELADKLISCKLPSNDNSFKDVVTQVQTHHHTKSCLKRNNKCRYNIPRLPSRKTLIGSPPPPEKFSNDEEKEKYFEESAKILKKGVEILENEKDISKLSFDEFIKKLEVCEEKYEEYLSTTKRGHIIIMKRKPCEGFINNYNEEMLRAWNANMDIQLAIDVYAIISYIVSYVSKDESGMTQHLQDALKAAKDKPFDQQMRILNTTYLDHREKGASEAFYLLNSNMKLRGSNIGTVFVVSGFPENRSLFYVPVSESEDGDFEEEEDPDIIEIEGRGKFKPSKTLIDKYAARPQSLKHLPLIFFAINYVTKNKLSEKEKAEKDILADDTIISESELMSEDYIEKLPKYLDLKNGLGGMKKRNSPVAPRFHNSTKKDGYEEYYSEMILFTPWQNEVSELKRNDEKSCRREFEIRKEKIIAVRKLLYPGEDVVDKMFCEEMEDMRPQHVYDNLNCQGEQENDDDNDLELQDDPDYETFQWRGEEGTEVKENKNFESGKYKKISVEKEALILMTRNLVPEQKNVLSKVLDLCKNHVKARKRRKICKSVEPLFLVIHGGAGM